MSIIYYELGDLGKCMLLAEQDLENRRLYIAEAKLHIADLLTMIHMLCIQLGLNFYELKQLGIEHLKERYSEFKKADWVDIEGWEGVE